MYLTGLWVIKQHNNNNNNNNNNKCKFYPPSLFLYILPIILQNQSIILILPIV